MFKSSGKQIRVISIALFFLELVASIILAFVFGFEEQYSYYYSRYYSAFLPEVFWPILIGGPITAYIFNLILYGFGVIVDNNE